MIIKNCILICTIMMLCSTMMFAQRTYDSDKDPNNISLPTDQSNPAKMGDIVGINESGYVFWQWVYDSSNGSVFNPTVANSFKQTFPKMRIFHLMEKDYFGNNPSNQAINPCINPNYDFNRSGMCAIRDFYRVLRDDYPFIVSSPETVNGKGFPNKWYTASEWGGSPASIKENAYKYARAYLQTMDPDKNPSTTLVDRFYTSNEHWGADLGIDGYKAVCDGFIEGFTEYYQGSRFASPNQNSWVIKMWFGAFQAHKATHVWDNDYVETMMSQKSRQALAGLDIHPYSFSQLNFSDFTISEHPESEQSYFQSIKNMVKWRNENNQSWGLSATEFGWNDEDTPRRTNSLGDIDGDGQEDWVVLGTNGMPSTKPNDPTDWQADHPGVGEEAQALYSIRAYLLLARYGFESGYLYGTLNNNEPMFQNTGVYKTQPLIETVGNTSYFRYSNYPSSQSDFIGEKKIMPAIRKFRNAGIIGNKNYLQTLKEDADGVHAILVGDSPNGSPTHLVVWYAVNINKKNESQILAMQTNTSLDQLGLPSNLTINTSQNFTRLDWNESSINNVSSSSVYTNGTLKLTPIPIVIPLTSGTNSCVGQGGDNDNDGVCANQDCNDNDPNFPKPQGTPCNDNNSNTSGDVIQADGCTCAGMGGNPCQSVQVSTGNGSITISNITAGNTMKLRIIGSGTGWADRTLCDGNCSGTVTESGLIAGTYFIKALNSNPGCYAQQQVTVSTGGNPCANQGGDSDGDSVCVNVDCDDNNASVGAEQTPGTACDDGNPNTNNDVILANGCDCAGTGGDACQSIQITPSSNSVTISNVASSLFLRIIGPGTGWADQTICNGNCSSTETVPNLSPGSYTVKALNGSPFCYEQYNISISNNKLEQLDDSQPLLIFPNPIKNNAPTLVFNSPEDEQLDIQIYNINSQLVHSQSANTTSGVNEITLDLQNARLASGVYFVKAISPKYDYGATRFVKP